jgi:hypothetical protein
MCIERKERIPCLNDYIILLKALLNRASTKVINVVPSSPATFHEIVRKLRECLPDFVLNLMAHLVTWKTGETPHAAQLLPVIQNEQISDAIMGFLQANRNTLPYMLQLLMLSNTIEELWDNLAPVMECAGLQAQQMPPNNVNFIVMLEEIFRIFEEIFKRFDIKIADFSDKINNLLPNHPANSIFDAFIRDKRFDNLTRGVRDELNVSKLEAQCQAHLATMPPGSTIADAQRELNCVLFDCGICTGRNTPEFCCMFLCGHASCRGCFEKLKVQQSFGCPICRAKITCCVEINKLDIRFIQQPAAGGCASMPPPAKKSKGE